MKNQISLKTPYVESRCELKVSMANTQKSSNPSFIPTVIVGQETQVTIIFSKYGPTVFNKETNSS